MHQLYFFNYNNRNNNNVLSIFNVIIFTTMFLLISMPPSTNALDNGVGRTPPLGWNTWKTCGEKTCGHDICNEAEIKSVAIAMKNNGMYELGYNYVN